MSVAKKITLAVLVLAAIASLLYGLGVFGSGDPPVMTMAMVPVTNKHTGVRYMQPTFAFSDPVKITSLRFYNEDEYKSQGELALPVWAMKGMPTSADVRQFTYGRPIPKMRPEQKGVPPVQMTRDKRYLMVLKTNRGVFEQTFIYGPEQQ